MMMAIKNNNSDNATDGGAVKNVVCMSIEILLFTMGRFRRRNNNVNILTNSPSAHRGGFFLFFFKKISPSVALQKVQVYAIRLQSNYGCLYKRIPRRPKKRKRVEIT